MVEILLKKGSDINVLNFQMRSPLIYAILYNNMKLFEILLKFNPNLELIGEKIFFFLILF